MDIDTQPTPEPSGQPAEPTPEPTPAGESEPEQTPEPTPEPEPTPAPPQLTPEQMEERLFQKFASWTGRREKDLLDGVKNIVDSRFQQVRQQEPPPAPMDAATLLENPDPALQKMGYVKAADIPRIIQETVANHSEAEQRYTTNLIQGAASLMDADPLFLDKALGAEVVGEIQKGFGTLDRSMNPALAAQLLVNSAVANVVRKRAQVKANPLAGNRPMGPGNGTLRAPAPTPAKSAPIKLDPMAAKIAAMFGNTSEDAGKLLSQR